MVSAPPPATCFPVQKMNLILLPSHSVMLDVLQYLWVKFAFECLELFYISCEFCHLSWIMNFFERNGCWHEKLWTNLVTVIHCGSQLFIPTICFLSFDQFLICEACFCIMSQLTSFNSFWWGTSPKQFWNYYMINFVLSYHALQFI